jgi:ABC-type transporter MlaC component
MKIVDALMASASRGVTRRDEFASVIQHKGLAALIGDLRERAGNLQAEAARD